MTGMDRPLAREILEAAVAKARELVSADLLNRRKVFIYVAASRKLMRWSHEND